MIYDIRQPFHGLHISLQRNDQEKKEQLLLLVMIWQQNSPPAPRNMWPSAFISSFPKIRQMVKNYYGGWTNGHDHSTDLSSLTIRKAE
jgi:hypothetical protein